MLNTCILAGNLGADPEITYSQSGTPIATFNLAFHSGKDKTSWIRVTAFSHQAEICEKYLKKGARVAITSTLDQEKWETSEGETRTAYKLIANSIEFIKTKNGDKVQDEDMPF